MDRQEAREQLKGYLREYVESVTSKSRGADMYVCPLCGSGSGAHGTGAFSIKDGTSWKCFRCNAGGDIFDLYGAINNTADHNAQLQGVAELYGVKVDGYGASAQEDFSPAYQNQPKAERNTHTTAYTQEQETDYTGFFLQANRAVEQTDYWAKRGLSRETVDRFKLGFVAEWKHPKAPEAPATPRLIIPTSRGSYLARDTRDPATIPAEQQGYTKSKVGHIQLFNKRALQEADKPIFVVEGELDALSIIEVGGVAIALGTTAKSKALVELAKAQAPVQPLIIALDNDEVGQKASRELTERLRALNIPCYDFNPCGPYKDANEALQRDREGFTVAVAEAETLQDEAEQAKKDSYLKTSTANYLESFVDGIAASVDTPYISTGFSRLDSVLDGGLYEGLYIVGAISSLGKTTLIVQICDQIAQAGHDVLIFSLEMARTELMAKSISRHTLQTVLATGGDIRNAKTARGITTGKRYGGYSQAERELITSSLLEYGKYAQNIYISEGVGNIGVEQIRETVRQHILYTGKTPIVAVDYLQILAPSNERATDKQNMDKAVLELKRISRDYKTPVIGLSSFNRTNYKEAVLMEAFKESGAIEYSSDILIGLQLAGAGEKDFDVNEAKRKDPREVELVILKNRNGRTGDKLCFSFYPLFNYFKEESYWGEPFYRSKRTL